MQVSQILIELDHEIVRLQQARNLLAGESPRKKPGPKPSRKPTAKKRRKLSAEGRRKISEAMKSRWAARKKKAAAKAAK